jgi:signal transduction histidine kinase
VTVRDASSAAVHIVDVGGALRFEVRDDGRGFDHGINGRRSGLQGMADRLGALDGRVQVESVPGAGG